MKRITIIMFLLSMMLSWSLMLCAEPKPEKTRVRREIERLREIREVDPERYEQEIERYRRKLKRKLRKLREKNPEKYEEIHKRVIKHNHKWSKEKFEGKPLDRQRQFYDAYTNSLQKRVEYLKKNHPEKYRKLKEKIQRRKERMMKFGRSPPPDHFFKDCLKHGRKPFVNDDHPSVKEDADLMIFRREKRRKLKHFKETDPKEYEEFRQKIRKHSEKLRHDNVGHDFEEDFRRDKNESEKKFEAGREKHSEEQDEINNSEDVGK